MSFTVRQVSEMLGLSPAQIRAYATKGFLTPDRGESGELLFGFQDLVILRTAGELNTAQIPQRKVRRILERLREQLPAGRSLAAIRIAADGDRVVVRDGRAMWNPESGQSLFDFSVAELAEKTAPFIARAVEEARESEELSADDWFQLACELELTDVEQAQEAYERVIALDPMHADAHVNLGRILHEQRAPVAAEKHYRVALKADPHHETAAFNLGVALEDLGRFSEAIDAYRRAIDLDPENSDAHYNIAGIYERRGDKAAALRHLKACRASRK
ncbi:MAG TPA: tetratricopeptide repeat protein [Thermoanaerobaculia bacterium]|jgi:tetratricopeptide (TPR) repeat protein|nr:tetratricopeptide repeat protein [Thermoanaerobaculia bacterium]